MIFRFVKHILRAALLGALLSCACFAGDFSDGIDSGDGFQFGNDLKGKPNTSFHKAKARSRMKAGEAITGDEGDVNYGSVVDSEVHGDVTIIIEEGDTTIIK